MDNRIKDIENTFDISFEDIRDFINNFHSEMEKGLRGKKSSLKMLPTYASRPAGREEGKFLALDLGGTNFRVASLRLKGNRKIALPQIEKFVLRNTLITSTANALFDFIARSIRKFMVRHGIGTDEKHDIGFTFSFPIKQKNIAHGTLVKWTKGFAAKGTEGKDVVKLLNSFLKKTGIAKTKIVAIVNDTVGALISQSYQDPCCDVGVILGTGTNACYYEKPSRIYKLKPAKPTSEMVINIEWGNFNKLKSTLYDRRLDRLSQNPGEQLLEKMVSGMYLGKLVGLILADLGYPVDPGEVKTEHISAIETDNTKNLIRINTLAKELGIKKSGYSERKLFKRVCSLVSTRAARLAGAAIASVVTRMDPRLSVKHTIAIDGSLYEKHPGFAKNVKATLKKIFGGKTYYVTLKLTKDASVKGAAIVAASRKGKL